MKVVNEETLELEEMSNDQQYADFSQKIESILSCKPEELSDKYIAYKKAEEEFKAVYEPFKEKLIDLMKDDVDLSNYAKTIIMSDLQITYVSPSTRKTIDTKKLKEERPDIAKEFTKTTEVDATLRLSPYSKIK